MPETLTVEQVAELLLCDKETAAERLNRGELPGLKFGRSWIVPSAAFFQRLNELALEQSEHRRSAGDPTPASPKQKQKRGRPRFNQS